MPLHALALESSVGLFVLTCFVLRLARAYADSSRRQKQDAVVEAMVVLGLAEAPAAKTRLIVHNGLSASRRRL